MTLQTGVDEKIRRVCPGKPYRSSQTLKKYTVHK